MTDRPARRTQEQRRAETERRVLDAAMALSARSGSQAVTLAEVGEAAGYSRGIVYHHFGSRERLLEALIDEAQQFDVPAYQRDGLDHLARIIEAYLRNVVRRTPSARAKEITDLTGVGVGTLYRHFPQRADLVKAVVETGIDAVAEAGPQLSGSYEPAEALTRWIDRFVELLGTKRGLASALHSGNPAFDGLPGYFLQRLGPTLTALLDAAAATGAIRRTDITAEDLLDAITKLCQPAPGHGPDRGRRLVGLLIDGLRLGETGS